MDVPDWKKTKLSLETPYRDDHGERIPVLLDITPAGEQVFEPPENLTKLLGENLRRIFIEREVDFFERLDDLPPGCESLVPKPRETSERSDEDDESARDLPRTSLTPEELYNMRAECISQLFIALGEMTQARDLLSLLLSSTSLQPISTAQTLSQTALTATVVTKPPPIPSVEVFNAQLTIGGKDEALRKAANVFKQAASKLEGSLERSENYWADALKIRRANWGLTPAPLPFGAPTGKGADKTSKDFLISFGLEESPVQFQRRAVGHMATYDTESTVLQFPHRRLNRLRVSLTVTDQAGGSCISHNTANVSDSTSLDELLRATQKEIVDEEVFSVLIREASNLPAASTRVSERLIVIDAAEGIELRFEMIDSSETSGRHASHSAEVLTQTCNLIYHILHALLLSMHATQKSQRILTTGSTRSQFSTTTIGRSLLLQPVIDLLQYQQFCVRIRAELDKMVAALHRAGVPCNLQFDAVGETGLHLQRRLANGDPSLKVGGGALLRIDDRQTLRLTFASPSSLTAHLPQATLPIASVPQLCQLLSDEAERCLLSKLCDVGTQRCDGVAATWFVDSVSGKIVGRWEGCIVNFRVIFGQDFAVHSSAYRLDRGTVDKLSLVDTYSPQQTMSLVSWQQGVLEKILTEH